MYERITKRVIVDAGHGGVGMSQIKMKMAINKGKYKIFDTLSKKYLFSLKDLKNM